MISVNKVILLFFLVGVGIYFFQELLKKRNFRKLKTSIEGSERFICIRERWYRLKRKYEEDKIMKEIYEGISFLRNIINMDKGKNTTTDFIISRLAEKKGILKKTYNKMLVEIRVGNLEEAIELMGNRVDRPIAKEFGNLLIQWDSIEPEKLKPTLLSYQKTIREINITREKKQDEAVSEIIYFPVMINVMVIFLNFIYVAYFIEQKEILSKIF